MSPEDGQDPVCCCPCDPDVAEPADPPDPGEIAELKAQQRKIKKGKYGSAPITPHTPPEDPEVEVTWIEIELLDSGDPPMPVPSARYKVVTSEETAITGTLNEEGFARIENIPPGSCKVSFPEYDEECWEKA
jgi:hypothetical protein